MSTLSLCMIVRNEAQWIGECLTAIRPHVDEVILVDTGSTDGTLDLARPHDPIVIPLDWRDDFAAARNAGIDAATGDWILVIDADETIAEADRPRLRELIARDGANAYELTQRTYTDDATLVHWQPLTRDCPEARGLTGHCDVPTTRLFRRHPEIRYERRIHEMIVPSIERTGWEVKPSGLIVHHFKFLVPGDRRRSKSQHYLALSEAKVRERPDDAMAWRELSQAATECDARGRAAEASGRAVTLAPEVVEYHIQHAVALLRANRWGEAVQAAREALERFPDQADLLEALGEAQQGQGDLDGAAQAYSAAIAANPDLFRAHNNLGVVHLESGELGLAHRHLQIARDLNPRSALPLSNLALVSANHGDIPQARALLEESLRLDPRHWRAMIQRGDIEFEAGRVPEAETWYRRAEEIEGHSAHVDVKLCSTALAQGRLQDAMRFAERAANRDAKFQTVLEQVRAHAAAQGTSAQS